MNTLIPLFRRIINPVTGKSFSKLDRNDCQFRHAEKVHEKLMKDLRRVLTEEQIEADS